jgi:hypothetical protein
MNAPRALAARAAMLLGSTALLFLLGATLHASSSVTIHDGLATIIAKDASAAEILAEWGRAGGTTIVNAEKLTSTRLTIELRDVPEKQALDVVLRSAGGYLAVERSAVPQLGSRYDRIFIMASSVPPRDTGPTPAQRPTFSAPQPPPFVPFSPPGSAQRVVGPDGRPVADDQEGAPPPNRIPAPPGFFFGDPPSAAPRVPAPSSKSAPIGVPVPGMIVAPPQNPPPPQR